MRLGFQKPQKNLKYVLHSFVLETLNSPTQIQLPHTLQTLVFTSKIKTLIGVYVAAEFVWDNLGFLTQKNATHI